VLANAVPALAGFGVALLALLSPQCRSDPQWPWSLPSAFPSSGMPLFMQYDAAKPLLNTAPIDWSNAN